MKRKEVWIVNFYPSIGGEIQKQRPAVIVSNDLSNNALNRVQVVPITSKTERIYPGEAYVLLNNEKRKALANQITTISKLRIGHRIGIISDSDMGKIEHAIKTQLNL